MAFPILRLPIIAAKEIINSMEIFHIFVMSLLSKRTQAIIKFSIPSGAIEAEFYTRSALNVSIGDDGFYIDAKNIDKPGLECPFGNLEISNYDVTCYTKDSSKLVKYIVNIFNNPKVEVTVEMMTTEEDVIKLLRDLDGHVSSVCCVSMPRTTSTFTNILNECRHIKSLTMQSIVPDRFEYIPPKDFSVEELTVARCTSWMKLEDFMMCRWILIYESLPRDVTPFLKKLLDGDSKSEGAWINFEEDFDLEPIAMYLQAEIEDDQFEVERDDGKVIWVAKEETTLIIRVVDDEE